LIEFVTLALLVIETILLILTVVLLFMSQREHTGRKRLIESMLYTTRILTTSEYFHTILEGYGEAKNSVKCIITGRYPEDYFEREILERISREIRSAIKRGVKVKFLIPKIEDRIHVGYKYKQLGAEVKFVEGLLAHDLRLMIIDNRCTIIGLPAEAGEKQPTRKGFKIPSETLSKILDETIERYWNNENSVEYDEYLREIIEKYEAMHPGISIEAISNYLNLSPDEIRRIKISQNRENENA